MNAKFLLGGKVVVRGDARLNNHVFFNLILILLIGDKYGTNSSAFDRALS